MNPPRGPQPYGEAVTPGTAPRGPAPVAATRPEVTDVMLVRRMQSGDERALGDIYDRWFPVVNGLVYRMLKSASDVEEIVEETFWQAWRQSERYEPDRGSVQTWLLTIARSRALDRLRANRRSPVESIDDTSGTDSTAFVALASDPSVDVEHREQRRLVRASLASLPREQREALELGYFGGLSQSEIADRTGVPLGTVKTRMRLALGKLRERLAVLREDPR